MQRCFIAVDLPEEVKKSISESASLLKGNAKFVETQNLHITMLFLGDLPESKVDAVKKILSNLDTKAFPIEAKGLSYFGGDFPRVIFVCITEGADELASMSKRISTEAKSLGIKTDGKGFKAHITVARLKNGNVDAEQLKNLSSELNKKVFGRFMCSVIKLKSSRLSEKGPEYTDIYIKTLSS